jgi:phage/plasmid-like protein (TIGR03299 family)
MSTTDTQQDKIENPLDGRAAGYDRGEYGDGRFESGFMGGNKPAWHGLGTVIPEDVVTSEQAIELAGLDWEVVTQPLYVGAPTDPAAMSGWTTTQYTALDSHKAIGRMREVEGEMTYDAFGVVGKGFTPVQNKQAFAFADDLVDSSEAKWHTAGSLRSGRKVWMQMRVPAADVSIGGMEVDELVRMFLLISNAHDGSGALRIDLTPVRVVCENTQTLAIHGAQRSWAVRHTSGITQRMQLARKALELTFRYSEQLAVVGNTLVERKMTSTEFAAFVKQLVPLPSAGDPQGERAAKNRAEARAAIQAIYDLAPNLDNVRGTQWAALQAVAEYSDHGRPMRDGTVTTAVERRFIRATTDTTMKQRALRLLDSQLAVTR